MDRRRLRDDRGSAPACGTLILFSAAGRKLGRAQSVVSQTLANLESLIGVTLFNRSGRYPVLTEQGRALLEQARARGLADGLEPELGVVVNVLFPTPILTQAISGLQARFPDTPLRISVEGLGAVLKLVLDKTCAFGIRGPLGGAHPDLSSEYLLGIGYQMVAAPSHPLAHFRGPIPTKTLAHYVQLVLSDRSKLTEDKDHRVFSPKTWRLYDLGAKHTLLKAGLGWGGMPVDVIREDLDRGLLVPVEIADMTIATTITMSAIYRTDTPPGPAGRGFCGRLKV